MGDLVEIVVLIKVFRYSMEKKGFCVIGFFKSNIGYLDVAVGVVGLIKIVLVFKYKLLFLILNFEKFNF